MTSTRSAFVWFRLSLALLALGTGRAQTGSATPSTPERDWPGIPTARDIPVIEPGDRGLAMRVTFFPPIPPPLGSVVRDRAGTTIINGRRLVAPEELATEVGENFYPVLGTRLWEQGLSEALAQRLKTYQTTRATLVRELLDAITMAGDAEPAAREGHLRTFATTQTPRVVALEKEAEELRVALVKGGFKAAGADWNAERAWRLGVSKFSRPELERSAEFQVIRAAAYFQNALGIEQRWLLREIALELEPRAGPWGVRPVPDDELFAMFFSPGTARLRLPAGVPPDTMKKIAGYNGEREALKTELKQAIIDADKLSEAKRTRRLAELTAEQRPRLAALEQRADEIRRELALLPPPPAPKLTVKLPKEIEARIESYKKDRAALDAELFEFLRAQPRAALPKFGSIRSADERTKAIQSLARERSKQQEEARQAFQRDNIERYADLQRRAAELRRDLDALGQTMTDPATGRPMDAATVMRHHNTISREFEAIGRREAIYADYETAMIQPGLAVEQRRLLFSAALAQLAQPLPAGKRMPSGEPFPSMTF